MMWMAERYSKVKMAEVERRVADRVRVEYVPGSHRMETERSQTRERHAA